MRSVIESSVVVWHSSYTQGQTIRDIKFEYFVTKYIFECPLKLQKCMKAHIVTFSSRVLYSYSTMEEHKKLSKLCASIKSHHHDCIIIQSNISDGGSFLLPVITLPRFGVCSQPGSSPEYFPILYWCYSSIIYDQPYKFLATRFSLPLPAVVFVFVFAVDPRHPLLKFG